MPELPEVEVTRRRIAPHLVGRKVEAVRTVPSDYFFLTPPRELQRRLKGRRFDALVRHGKYLIASLDDGARLLMHLGMTGQLFTASARSVRLLSSTRGGARVGARGAAGGRGEEEQRERGGRGWTAHARASPARLARVRGGCRAGGSCCDGGLRPL